MIGMVMLWRSLSREQCQQYHNFKEDESINDKVDMEGQLLTQLRIDKHKFPSQAKWLLRLFYRLTVHKIERPDLALRRVSKYIDSIHGLIDMLA